MNEGSFIQGSRALFAVDFVVCLKIQHFLSAKSWLSSLRMEADRSLSFVSPAPALASFGIPSPAASPQCGTLS